MTSNLTSNYTSNHTTEVLLYLDRLELLIWIGVTLVQSLVGTVAMVLLLIAILTKQHLTGYKRLREHTGALIAHLTIIELVILAIHSTVNLVVVYNIQTRHTMLIDCNLTHAFYASFIFAGNWSMCIIALNRFVALIFPHHFKHLTTKSAIVSMILFSWTLAFGEMWPLYFDIGGAYGMARNRGCDLIRADAGNYFQSVLVLFYYLPLSLMVGVYALIFIVLQCQKRRLVADDGRARTQRSLDSRVRLTRMLFGCAVWFFVCYIPGPICIAAFFEQKQRSDSTQFLWTRVVALSGNTFSPMIAFLLNSDYRKSLGQFHRQLFPGSRVSETATSSGRGSKPKRRPELPLQRSPCIQTVF